MEQQFQSTVNIESSGKRTVSRVLSAVIMALAVALLLYQSQARDSAMGKAAYLANESASYDKILAHPLVWAIVIWFVMICIFLGVYELLAFVIYKVIPKDSF